MSTPVQTLRRAGFVGTRFAGTDGVSLETTKWEHVFARMGIDSVYFCGVSDHPPDSSYIAPHAFFEHPEIMAIQEQCFGTQRRPPELSREIRRVTELLKQELYRFLELMQPDFLVPENALAIPMNIPLGLAITELIAETGMPTIAHHHDFAWERDRFRVNAVADILAAAFPPRLPTMRHAVINLEAQRQLAYRCGLSSVVVPNVFEFALPAPRIDDYNSDLRTALGIAPDEIMLLQPTRIIARKGIEHTLELASRLHRPTRPVVVVIPHQELDEGDAYARRVLAYAEDLGVRTIVRSPRVALTRGRTGHGDKVYSLWDLYLQCDFVCYPSLYEGFGNAFVEAVVFRKPICVNRYSVYREDMEPLGFQVVTMDSYITDEVVNEVERLLRDPAECKRRAEANYAIAARSFSYDVLESRLRELVAALIQTAE